MPQCQYCAALQSSACQPLSLPGAGQIAPGGFERESLDHHRTQAIEIDKGMELFAVSTRTRGCHNRILQRQTCNLDTQIRSALLPRRLPLSRNAVPGDPSILGNDNTGILMAGTTKCTVLRYLPGGMVNYLRRGTAMPAEVGEVAPDFTLPSVSEGDISLSQYRGQKHVVLSFHVFDFTSG